MLAPFFIPFLQSAHKPFASEDAHDLDAFRHDCDPRSHADSFVFSKQG